MKKTYLSFVAFVAIAENAISAFGLMFATFFTVVQIVNRYWLHLEIMWLADLNLYVFVLGSIFSIALTTRQDAHTCVDVFVELLFRGAKAKKLSKILINLVSLGILCVILPLFYAYFLRALKYDEWGTLVPWFNTSWLVEAIFVMFVLNIFHIAHNTVVHVIDFCGLRSGGDKK
ncbi:MAG: TRAP transporter small permease subunit [Synergistaceae bacterium]|jgi:TRAP-type C4-dicarboxylate transport system permease small subunit|nr:TRAP transporter small permease subunit [Synergistaceae bacterium]